MVKDINSIVYLDIPNGSEWRIDMAPQEIIECNFGRITVPGFDRCQIDPIC